MITKYLLFAWHFLVCFAYGYNLTLVTTLWGRYDYFPYVTDLETQSQKTEEFTQSYTDCKWWRKIQTQAVCL